MNAFEGRTGVNLQRALMVGAWALVILLIVCIVYVVSSLRYVGSGIPAANTISVSGTGQAYAVPDTAQFTFSVSADAATVAAAQTAATAKINAVTQYLTSAGVDKSDIQTTDYEINPTYKNEAIVCPEAASASGVVSQIAVYCPQSGNQVLTGYEVSQTTQVKVTDTDKAGDLLSGVGGKGATNVSGLQFTESDPSATQDQARDKAIADAQSKAQKLAKELGVSLVRVTSFDENSGGYPMPVAFSTASGATAKSVSPEISVGQNEVTDNVTITYEIR